MVKAKTQNAKSIPSAFTLQASHALKKTEWLAAAALTLLALWLRWEMARHAGGLWRDEANTVGLATLPKLSEVWENLQFDSFPVFWLAVVRWLSQLGLHSDFHFRALGFFVGAAILGACWFNARRLKISLPFFSLLFLGLSPSVIRFGDSMRAYGWGVFWLLLTYGLIWSVVESATPRRVAAAAICAICAVHSIYYNAIIVFALCVAGMVVTLRRGRRKSAALLLFIGIAAAISLLPYVRVIARAGDWNALVQGTDLTFAWFFNKLVVALAPDALAITCVASFCAALLGGFAWLFLLKPATAAAPQKDLLIFSFIALPVGAVSYYAFLKLLNYPTQPWYYLALIAFCAASFDAIFSVICAQKVLRIFRWLLPALVGGLILWPVLEKVRERVTNIDLIAAELNHSATEKDYILLDPWYTSVSFNRYYSGRAEWTTVPPLGFYRFHRYDLFKEKMMATDQMAPILPALQRISQTLQSGNRVWLIGGFRSMETNQPPPLLAPAPAKLSPGYSDEIYSDEWGFCVNYLLAKHGAKIEAVPIAVNGNVNSDEDPLLISIRGWK